MVDDPRSNDSSRQDDDSRAQHHKHKLVHDADLTSPDSRKAFDNKNDKDNPAGIPHLQVVRSLDGNALHESAQKLHDSIKHENWLGLNDAPQESRVKAILEPLSKADRQALEKTYHDMFDKDGAPDTLRRDLKDKLGDTDFRKAESMLNREDGRANDAGELRVALSQLGDHKDDGNANVQQIFSTLNSKQIATMRGDWQKQYGESMDSALSNTDGLTDATKKALPTLMKGSDQRTPQDNVELANLAVTGKDQGLLSVALRGDTEAARGAREKLKADPSFSSQLDEAFPDNHAVHDYVSEGRISLRTIADKSQGGFLGIGENKSNFELALKNIDGTERDLFLQGKKISETECPTSGKEKEAVDYYKKIHNGLNDLGDDREVSRWEDMIAVPGGTLISRLADQHDDHEKVFASVETMSKGDWTRLTDKESGPQYRKDLMDSASHYLDDGEQARLGRLLDAKTSAIDYDASQQVSQPLVDIVDQGDAGKIADRIMHLNPQDRRDYQENPDYRKQIDDKVKGMDGEGGVLVRHLLSQVENDASLPQFDSIDQVLYDRVKKAPAGQLIKDAQTALEDPELRARLSKNENLNEREDALRSSLSSFFTEKEGVAGGGRFITPNYENPDLKELLEKGRLSLDKQKNLDVPPSYLYTQLPAVSEGERKDFIDGLSDDQKAIAENVQKQDGKLSLADQLRSYLVDGGSDFKTFTDPLKQLQNTPKGLGDLKQEYAQKYKNDLSDDLAHKLDGGDERTMLNLLNPSGVPIREDFYHVLDEHHESGINIDGTDLTLQKSVDQFAATLEKYQSQFKDVPEGERQRMNDFFAQADQQYKDSKEAFAKFVVNAVLIGGAVVAAPFTGGMSMAGVAAIAAAGAAFRTGAMATIQGDDFDGSASNILKQSLLGGAAAGSTFLGPSALAGLTSIGKEAAEHTAAALATSEGTALLKEGAESGLQKELQNMYMNATVRGEDIGKGQWEALSAKFVKDGGDKGKLAELLEQTSNRELKQSSETYLLDSLKQKGKAELRETAFNTGTTVANNVGYNLAVAPVQGYDGTAMKDSIIAGTIGGAVIGPAFKGIFRPASDETERLLGQPAQRVTKKFVSEEMRSQEGSQLLSRLRNGDRVSFMNEPGWKVKGFDDEGNLVITHDAERQVSVGELKQLNGSQFQRDGLRPGAQYSIAEDGHHSEGWQVDSLDMHNGDVNVVKVDAKRRVIKREEVVTGQTPLTLEAAS
jgi:hypothetical protein